MRSTSNNYTLLQPGVLTYRDGGQRTWPKHLNMWKNYSASYWRCVNNGLWTLTAFWLLPVPSAETYLPLSWIYHQESVCITWCDRAGVHTLIEHETGSQRCPWICLGIFCSSGWMDLRGHSFPMVTVFGWRNLLDVGITLLSFCP